MFSKEDYLNYFNEVEEILKKTLVIYTDLINSLDNQAFRNKLLVLVSENMETFNFIKELNEKIEKR